MRLTLITAPAAEPISPAEATTHLKGDGLGWPAAETTLVTALVAAARGHAERITQRQLITATWKVKYDRFPRDWRCPLTIPLPPLLTVTGIQYLDGNGALQTWSSSDYVVDAPAGPYALEGRIYPAFAKDYPSTCDRADAVIITFTAGYGPAAADVPQAIKQAMYLMIGHWYENRETVAIGETPNEIPWSAEALLAPFQRLSAVVR